MENINYTTRGKYIHISTTLNKVRYRFSTNLLANDKNYKFVEKNSKKLINDYISQQKDNSFNIAIYGQKVLNEEANFLKENTLIRYENIFNKYIKPTIGNINIKDVTAKDAKDLFITHFINCSPANKALVLTILRKIFNHALLYEIITSNPFLLIKNNKKNIISSRNKPLTYDEMFKLLHFISNQALDSQHIDSQHKDSKKQKQFLLFIAIALLTGARTGEIFALHYEDINLHNKKILINKSLSNNKISTTKTGNNRYVTISPLLLEFFKKFDSEFSLKSGLIFTYSNYQFKKLFLESLKACDISQTTLYSTRHTFASYMIEKTGNYQVVANMLGHKDASITFKSYVKSLSNERIFDFMLNDYNAYNKDVA